MSDLIDRKALMRELIGNRSFYPAIVKSAIENAPAVDAVEVVRCKDCKRYYNIEQQAALKQLSCQCAERLRNDNI